MRGGIVWGTLHWSWVDLGFGLQEETRTSHGSREAAATGRILEKRSALLSLPKCRVRVVAQDLGILERFFFPWGEEHISVAT